MECGAFPPLSFFFFFHLAFLRSLRVSRLLKHEPKKKANERKRRESAVLQSAADDRVVSVGVFGFVPRQLLGHAGGQTRLMKVPHHVPLTRDDRPAPPVAELAVGVYADAVEDGGGEVLRNDAAIRPLGALGVRASVDHA